LEDCPGGKPTSVQAGRRRGKDPIDDVGTGKDLAAQYGPVEKGGWEGITKEGDPGA